MKLLVVWAKELLDTLRDRRTLWAMVLGPVLVMPVFVLLPQKLVQRQAEKQEESVVHLAVSGAEHAPGLMTFLRASGEVEVREVANPEAAVRAEEATVGLVVSAGFEESLGAQQTADLQLLADESKMFSSVQVGRVRTLLQTYSQAIVTQRLEQRGVDPRVLVPFVVGEANVATPRQMSGALLGMTLPMFIVLWALVGGMYTAIDVTAGEKERLTLEPLLSAPVGRAQVVLGKLLAVITTSIVALVLAVVSMLVAFAIAPPVGGEEASAISAVGVDLRTALLILLASLPIVVVFSALEMAVCLMARSFKEAQNYIVPMQFVVLIPAIAVMVMPDLSPSLPAFAIPIFSTLVVLRDLFLGKADATAFGLMAASSVVYAAVAIGLAVWQFGRERVLFRT